MDETNVQTPTGFELEILKVLWRIGPATARQVLEDMMTRRVVGYTTILKMLQVMEEKGLVTVDRAERSHVFHPAVERERTLAAIVGDLVDRVFDGSMDNVLVHLARKESGTARDLAALKKKIAAAKKSEGRRRD